MQLTGMQLTAESALAGNDIGTLPDFPASVSPSRSEHTPPYGLGSRTLPCEKHCHESRWSGAGNAGSPDPGV